MTNSKDARSIEPRSAGDDDVAHEMRSLPRATSHRLRLARRLQSFDTLIAVLGAVAPCMIGPLRAFTEAHTQVAFVSTLALFMVPGILMSHWFLGEYFRGAALVPVAFVLSVSLFGVWPSRYWFCTLASGHTSGAPG